MVPSFCLVGRFTRCSDTPQSPVLGSNYDDYAALSSPEFFASLTNDVRVRASTLARAIRSTCAAG